MDKGDMEDAPSWRWSQGGSTTDTSDSQAHTVRLNPLKCKQWKLSKKECRVLDLENQCNSSGGLAPPDDSQLGKSQDALTLRRESFHTIHKSSKRMFSGMFHIPKSRGCFGTGRNVGLELREEYKMPPKRVTWWQVTLFLLNDINMAWLMLFSAMILGTNGWIFGLLVLVVLWPINLYTAHLLWRCRNIFPGAISIGDLVYYISHSSWAMYITFFFVNLTIALTLSYSIAVAYSNFYWLSGLTSGKCSIVFIAGVCFVLLPASQLRTLHSLTIINAINLVCMLCFVVTYLYFLAREGPSDDAVTRFGLNLESWHKFLFLRVDDPVEVVPLVGMEVLLSAYHYQLLSLEIMAEMKDPRDFPKANFWCTPVVLFVAVFCSAFRYYFQGESVNLFLVSPFSVISSVFDESKSALAYFGMVCFAIKMLGTCLTRSVILTRSMQLLFNPKVVNQHTWRSRFEWGGISLLVIGFVFLLTLAANSVLTLATFFAILSVLLAIMLPIVLYILCKGRMKQLKSIPWYELALMICILAVSIALIAMYFVRVAVTNSTLMHQQSNNTRVQFHLMTQCSALS